MTTVDRNGLLVGVCLVALTFVAATFAGIERNAVSMLVFPMIILIELIIYFIAAMISNPRATVGMAAGTAIVLMMIRAVCALGGGLLYSLVPNTSISENFIYVWVNPIVVIIQVVMLLFAGPYLMAVMMPDLLGAKQAARLRGEQGGKNETSERTALETHPTGGFIQVFSFEELAAVIKKSHGIEGFIIVSSEGLVVWKDFPLRINQDILAARFFGHAQGISQLVEQSGLTKVRRVMVESREHFLFATTLDQNFSLILFFNGRAAPEEILSRIAVLSKSCREFLQWKYPSLPLKAAAPKDPSLEMA